MRLGAALILLIVATPACGGQFDNPSAGGGSGGDDGGVSAFDGALPPGVRSVPECGAILPVPAGTVYVGGWSVEPNSGAVSPEAACGSGPSGDIPGNRVLYVPTFFLMAEPSTNVCYARCVAQGVCRPPVVDPTDPNPAPWTADQRSEEPTHGDYYDATQFCQWMGGRLPSVAELLRAAQGDKPTLGIAALTAAVFDCRNDPNLATTELCAETRRPTQWLQPGMGLYAVGTAQDDVGPFGHKDLWASTIEWTQSVADYASASFCGLANGTRDPVRWSTSSQRELLGVGAALAPLEQAMTLPPNVTGGADSELSGNHFYFGFRCAFDSGSP